MRTTVTRTYLTIAENRWPSFDDAHGEAADPLAGGEGGDVVVRLHESGGDVVLWGVEGGIIEIILEVLVYEAGEARHTPNPAVRGSRVERIKEVPMPTVIRISVKQVTLDAELFDTPCASSIARALPLEARPAEWGDEFYFEIPVKVPLDETATTEVKVGDIGYWPPGSALAIFFGPTPMSTGRDPVPASAVNLVGRILGDAGQLRDAKGAGSIRIEEAQMRS